MTRKIVKLATTEPTLENHHFRVSARLRGNQFKHDHWTTAPRLLYIFRRENWRGETEFPHNIPDSDQRVQKNQEKLENFARDWWKQERREHTYGEDVEAAIRAAIDEVDRVYTEKFERSVNDYIDTLTAAEE